MLDFLKKKQDEKSDEDIVLGDADDGGKILIEYKNKDGEVILPDALGITEIGDNVFKSSLFGKCKITKIQSNTVKKIGKKALMDAINWKVCLSLW